MRFGLPRSKKPTKPQKQTTAASKRRFLKLIYFHISESELGTLSWRVRSLLVTLAHKGANVRVWIMHTRWASLEPLYYASEYLSNVRFYAMFYNIKSAVLYYIDGAGSTINRKLESQQQLNDKFIARRQHTNQKAKSQLAAQGYKNVRTKNQLPVNVQRKLCSNCEQTEPRTNWPTSGAQTSSGLVCSRASVQNLWSAVFPLVFLMSLIS
jgi:hypothetical protein